MDPAAPEQMFVGVIPFGLGKKNAHCQVPYGEAVTFEMDDEDMTACSYATGDLGEGSWVLPDAVKPDLVDACLPSARPWTVLQFCRVAVEKGAFRPLTTDQSAIEDFYAVLLLGERCPEGSIEIRKRIYNEDDGEGNRWAGDPESLYPNEITTGILGSRTTLHFCYFRAAASEAETMREFPVLGFSYGVFHDFDVAQPGWVLAKRWQISDDSNNTSEDENYYLPPEGAITEEFMTIVENPRRRERTDTCFDMARVR